VGVALPWRSQELKRCNGPVAGGGWFGVARVDPGIDLVQGRHGAGGFGYSPALSGVDPGIHPGAGPAGRGQCLDPAVGSAQAERACLMPMPGLDILSALAQLPC